MNSKPLTSYMSCGCASLIVKNIIQYAHQITLCLDYTCSSFTNYFQILKIDLQVCDINS